MLVLTRKHGQDLMLTVLDTQGQETKIRVRLISTKGPSAQVGIQAPANVRIVRAELLEQPRANG